MAKNKAPMTVVTGKTLGNLIDLQMATQDSLNKINAAMQESADKKSSDNQQIIVDLNRKLLDVTMDNFKLNKKIADNQSKTFDELSKNVKSWKTWGDKLKDMKAAMSDKFSADSFQKKLLKGLNIGGMLNQKIMALDFKKQAKELGTAPKDKRELDKQAKEFATAQMAMMRENSKIEQLKKRSGATDDQIKNSPKGAELISNRDKYAQTVSNLMPGGKSQKDLGNKMGGNTGGISVPLSSAENNPLSVAPTAKEGELESQRMNQQNADNIQRIADNTDTLVGLGPQKSSQDQTDTTSSKGMLGGLLDSVFSMFSDGFLTAIRSVFSIRSILRVVTKFFAPAMLIGSLVNGIMDGFNAWMETGSIKDALIAGLGGVIEFLSFGMFDKDTVKGIVNAVSGFVDQFITQPVMDFVNGLGDAFSTYIATPIKQAFDSMMEFAQNLGQLFTDYVTTPIQNAFEPIQSFFSDMIDSVMNILKNIQIPGVNIKLPLKDDPIQIGPWRPFDTSSDSAKNVDTVTPSTGQKVMSASKANADEAALVDGKSKQAPAPSVNTNISSSSSTNQVIKVGVRNQESSQSKYLAARY